MKSKADISLTKAQSQVWHGKTRFKTLVTGRRFGKTFFSLVWLLAHGSRKKGIYYYIAPSYVMAKSIAWRMLKDIAAKRYVNKNESELYIELHNGAVIQLKGAENRDSLRGVSLAGAVLDEAAYMAEEVWTEVIRPATSDQNAPVLFISTPAGWNWFKTLCDYAQNGNDPNWEYWTFTTLDGGNVSQSEIEAARRELPEKVFKQEFLASFETLQNRVYSNFDRTAHVISTASVNDADELLIGLDFNINPMSAVVGVKIAEQLHIVDEIELPNSNTQELAQEIKRRYPKHQIRVYPDPSGKARKTSAGGATDFTILSQAGFRVIAPRKAPAIADRVNEVQAAFRAADGTARLFIHPRCKSLIRSLDGQTYRNNEPDKTSGLDHMNDALGYLIHSIYPIRQAVIYTGIGSAL